MRSKVLFWSGAAILFSAALGAAPVSNCALNNINDPNQGLTCNIFEADASGNPSDISNVVSLPFGVGSGYLLLFENAIDIPSDPSDPGNPSQWSDVLNWIDDGSGKFQANTLQFSSIGCNVASGDTSCFPSSTAAINAAFATVTEDPSGTTLWRPNVGGAPGNNFYYIHSDELGEVPEPASMSLLGIGLLGVVVVARKKYRR